MRENHGDEKHERDRAALKSSPISMQAAGSGACASGSSAVHEIWRASLAVGRENVSRSRNNNATDARAAGIASWRCAITAA